MNRLLLILCVVFASTAGLVAQTTIEGKVKDVKTKEPILFGTIALYRGGVLITGTETDLDGNYFISDVQPGTYEMEASYVGYATQKQTGIVIKAGKTNKVDFDLSDDAVLLDLGIEIKEHRVPLIEIDNTTQGATVTAEKIRALPTKQINAIAATSAGISSRDGGDISIRGSRSNETVYFLDGVRVTGNMIPQSEVEQLQVVVGGVEARYGDVTGGVISLTSRGPSSKISGSLEIEKSLDGFGYNLYSGNISGPILKNKKKQSILGYRFSGQYRKVNDNNPSAIGVYRVPESLIRTLEQNPTYSIGEASFPSIELYGNNDIGKPFKARPNDDNTDIDLTGRLDIKPTSNIDIQISGNYNDGKNRFGPGSSGVSGSSDSWVYLNWVNNPYSYNNTYRGNFRLTHKLGKQSFNDEGQKENVTSNFRNFSYTITLGYQNTKQRIEDFRHEDRLFDYGYFGTTERSWAPVFSFRSEDDPLSATEPFGHVGYNADIGTYTLNETINPVLGSYNAIEGVNVNGLLNQNINSAWNNIFANVGQVYNRFSKTDDDLISINFSTGFDLLPGGSEKGRHNIQFGVLYEQSVNRSWLVRPFGLWNTAEILANNHINGLNYDNIVGKELSLNPFTGQLDTFNLYETKLNIDQDNQFYSKVRDLWNQTHNEQLSIHDYVNVWAIDPSLLKLDLFSANELILQNQIDYYGFDYLGNKLGTDVRFEDFFTSRDAEGRRTFVVAPQQPIYSSVYLQDKFSYKDIIFRLGVRADYYDANTKVLRDNYALYEIETAKDYYSRIGKDQPSSVADDYKVYVADEESDNLVAFRKGDQWYLPNGTAVSGGNVIYQGGLVTPSYVGKTTGRVLNIQDSDFDPNTSFVDYKPKLNFMPRLAFSFPISDDAGFFAHYDVLYQRPPSNAYASPLDYYFWNDKTRINPNDTPLDNPNLNPIRTIDYEVGFQQKVSDNMALKVSAYYKEMKDLIQQRVLANVASPLNTYKIYDNLDFGTVKGFSFTLDRRRTNNIELTATYTLQFADGSGSDANSSSGINNFGSILTLLPLSYDERHRVTTVIDYRYGSGKSYNGPRIGNVKILEEFGVNLTSYLVSGQPYTLAANVKQFDASGYKSSINGARLPWNFTTDLNVQKRLPITISKATGKQLNFNVYLRVQNLFNTKNIINVYKYSNDPEDDGFLNSSIGQDRIDAIVASGRNVQNFLDAYNWRMNAPGNYTQPRRIYVGAILDF